MFVLYALAAETTAEAGGIAALGFDLTGLLFQILNFIVLLWLLKKFAYQPVLKILQERQRKIEEGLKNAETAGQEKEALAQEKETVLAAARKESQEIVASSKRQAEAIVKAAETKAENAAEGILEQAEARLTQAEQQARKELKQEILGLVKRATEKVIGQKLDTAADEELIKASLKEVSTGKNS